MAWELNAANGTLRYAAVAYHASVDDFTTGTVAGWVSWRSTGDHNHMPLWERVNGSLRSGFFLWRDFTTSRLQGLMLDAAVAVGTVDSTTTFAKDNAWWHIALVFSYANGGTSRLYVNGVLEDTATNSGAITPTTDTILAVGQPHVPFAQEAFQGRVAGMALYSTELAAPDILALSKGFSPRRVRPSVLFESWTLDRYLAAGVPGERRGLALVEAVGSAGAYPHPRMLMPRRWRQAHGAAAAGGGGTASRVRVAVLASRVRFARTWSM